MRVDVVKSFGEKLIANTLFEYGLDYRYEHDVRWNGFNYKPGSVRKTVDLVGLMER